MSRALATALPLILVLAACTTSEVLEPSAMVGPSPTPPTASVVTPPATTAPLPGAGGTVAAINTNARIQIAPIVGSTVEAVTPLTERFAIRARERGIGLAGSADPATTHVLKGYFSAIAEGQGTTVIYVWDVLDPAGNRLHRIQGQQKAEGNAGWQSVQPATMQAIADATIDQLATWLAGSAG
jgi:hypothetical protein